MAFAPGWPGTEMPYSVSMPITRRTLMPKSLMPGMPSDRTPRRRAAVYRSAALGGYRYWPVLATVSIDRPASVPLLPEMRVRM